MDCYDILMVDDHQMFIDGIKSLLRKVSKFNICAEALSGNQALSILKEKHFDIVITDISMPQMSGVELTKTIKQTYPETKVMVFTMHNNREVAQEILQSEAEGFILKNTGKAELVNALETITNNGTYYCCQVLSLLMQHVKNDKQPETVVNLSPREKEVLTLICGEYSSEQIAEKLFISRRTVDTHRIHIYEKTGCKTLVSLIKYAVKNGLVEF